MNYTITMTIYPTLAYDLLSVQEKEAADRYVEHIITKQRQLKQPLSNALSEPIPVEWVLKSHNVLERPLVRAAISEKLLRASHVEDMSPDKVVREYICLATSDIGDFLEADSFGNMVAKDLKKIDPIKRRAIRTFESKPTSFGVAHKIVLHDKLPALRALSEMMGLVEPDKPPVLQDYGRPKTAKIENEEAPEVEYQRLLESST